MLSSNDRELLRDQTLRLLEQEGMKIEHQGLIDMMLKAGCSQASNGRVRIPSAIIDEMVAAQKSNQQADADNQTLHYRCGIDWAHHIIWHGRQADMRAKLADRFLMSAFDCGPTKYYDWPARQAVAVNTDNFTTMMKFAQATPEIGYTSTWYRQDINPYMERLESLYLGRQLTDKLDGIEAIYPEVVKYLKEASEILTGTPGDSSFLAGSECITSPLILEERSAQDIVARHQAGVHRYHIATMPSIGLSTPATIAGATILMAAEVLGGMAVCHVLDPGSDLSGRAICLGVDMKTANNTPTAPEVTLANLAVRELFDQWWGGQCWVEVFFSPYAKRPGLQAVMENFFGSWRYAKVLGDASIPYAGMGTLDSGATGSPTQLMLDMEIRKGQYATLDAIPTSPDQLAFDEICEVVRQDGGFLDHEHTMTHFRNLWSSPMFATTTISDAYKGDETALLDICEQKWRDNLGRWEPPDFPDDQKKALENLLDRARKEFANMPA